MRGGEGEKGCRNELHFSQLKRLKTCTSAKTNGGFKIFSMFCRILVEMITRRQMLLKSKNNCKRRYVIEQARQGLIFEQNALVMLSIGVEVLIRKLWSCVTDPIPRIRILFISSLPLIEVTAVIVLCFPLLKERMTSDEREQLISGVALI